MTNYLQERLDKSKITGVRNQFWARMLLAKKEYVHGMRALEVNEDNIPLEAFL